LADWKLKHFSGSELLFDQEQSFRILQFFGIEPGIQPGSFTDEDRSFAQAILVEAIDASYEKRYVQAIFDVFYMKPVTSVDDLGDMLKEFLECAVENWFDHATKADLRDPQIFNSVRVTMARNIRSVWTIRVQTGEMTY
jgi:hypothetical protein